MPFLRIAQVYITSFRIGVISSHTYSLIFLFLTLFFSFHLTPFPSLLFFFIALLSPPLHTTPEFFVSLGYSLGFLLHLWLASTKNPTLLKRGTVWAVVLFLTVVTFSNSRSFSTVFVFTSLSLFAAAPDGLKTLSGDVWVGLITSQTRKRNMKREIVSFCLLPNWESSSTRHFNIRIINPSALLVKVPVKMFRYQ